MNNKVYFAIRITVSYLIILLGVVLDIPKPIIIFSIVWYILSDLCHLFMED